MPRRPRRLRQRHDLQLDHVRLSQQAERIEHRRAQIGTELEEIAAEEARETQVQERALRHLDELSGRLEDLEGQVQAARDAHVRMAVSDGEDPDTPPRTLEILRIMTRSV